ncbi:MAG: hypothetical protein WBA63_08240 [Thermomicrobiales bacterium]
MRAALPVLMVLVMSVGFLGQASVPHPQPRIPTFEATPGANDGAALGCDDLADYAQNLNRAFADSGEFRQVLSSASFDFQALTSAEGKVIVRDGKAFVTTIEKLEVPPVYSDGNKGIVMFMTFLTQEVSFYSIDSSTVPDLDSYDKAMQLIYNGETNAAAKCPKQVKSMGGYIFLNPKDIEDQFNTGN